jgi:hypothetical protein
MSAYPPSEKMLIMKSNNNNKSTKGVCSNHLSSFAITRNYVWIAWNNAALINTDVLWM